MADKIIERRTAGGNLYRGIMTRRESEQKINELKKTAFIDERTGLLNAKGFNVEFDTTKEVFIREGLFNNYAIIVCDLIGLHQLNHDIGRDNADIVLKNVGIALNNHIRGSDIASRYDGDEFAIAIFNTTNDGTNRIISEVNDNLPEHARFCIAYKQFDPKSNFKANMDFMKTELEKVKSLRNHDENGRVMGEGIVVQLS